MWKKFSILIVIILFSIDIFSQTNNSIITGTVQDKSSKQPVEFASVQLLNQIDSFVLKTSITDHRGKFLIDNVIKGNYILRISFIGFNNIQIPITVNQLKENIGTIEIALVSKNMNEVVVTSRKSLLNTAIDRKIYNVSQDIMAQSGTASDIFKNIPSVEVDIEGQVSLRGSSDVMILINGRPSPLMGKTRAEVLQQLPANSIERIEVITNPSARYKPDGTSGIINIVLKKNTKFGWNGSAIANVGNHYRYNGSLSLNYKPGKLNIYSNYNIRRDNRIRINNITREYLDSAGKILSYYTEDNQSQARPLSNILTLGADYTLNEHNSFGISGNYHHRDQTKNDMVKKYFYDKNHLLTGNFNRLRFDPEYEKEKDATAYWQHNFLKEDEEFRAELNVSASDEAEDNHYTNAFYFPPQPFSFDNTLIKQGDYQQELTIDYTNPLT